ncbi:MAG: hypothetical protein K0R65_3035 [Crocinitomicaceae bacterium]|jgi:hypothetical protein|nr:hypothetical protein [Crocinitomicaceae bacterium]
MLKNTLLLLILVSATYGFSQEIDNRLLAKYSKEEINSIRKNNPEEYTFLVNALDKGVVISEIPAQKAKDIVFDGTLEIDPNGTHTFISLGKEITDRYQYYKIAGTSKMLTIKPRPVKHTQEIKIVRNNHKANKKH